MDFFEALESFEFLRRAGQFLGFQDEYRSLQYLQLFGVGYPEFVDEGPLPSQLAS